MSSDIKRQSGTRGVDFDFFSLACDESTEASDTARLLIFVRAVNDDMNVTEELLDLQSLENQTRGTDLFASVCSAVDDVVSGIVTDGAPAMAGERSGLSTLVIKSINFIRSKALCQFQQFLLDIHAEIVCHNDVRWLSRGSALHRFYALRGEIRQFSPFTVDPNDAPHQLQLSSLSCSVTASGAVDANDSLL